MNFLKLINFFIILVLITSCDSYFKITFFSKDKNEEYFFLKRSVNSYDLTLNYLSIPLINEEMIVKYPSAIQKCVFKKNSNPTYSQCGDLAPNLIIDPSGIFKWNTSYFDNGTYSFNIDKQFKKAKFP